MRYWPVYGGGETITVTLANELVERGHEVHILYNFYKDCDPMPYQLDEKIVQRKMVTIENYKSSDVDVLHNYLIDNKIDIMVNQWGATNLCYEAKRSTPTKLITCWHLDVIQKQRATSAKEKILKFFLGEKIFQKFRERKQLKNHYSNYTKSDKYIFLSKSFADCYRKLSQIDDNEKKIDAISNPLTYDIAYDKQNLICKKKQVLLVGRLYEYHKRISLALKIWKQIELDSAFDEWCFKIVGDGPDLQSSVALAKSLGLKRVSFEGFKNPRPYYEESSVFVMTSAFEGFGMTLVEAQQYGVVPVVMDSYTSLHDILKHENNGIIVNNGDIDEFVAEMKNIMRNDSLRRTLAMNGLESCLKFKVQFIVDSWETLFGQLVG